MLFKDRYSFGYSNQFISCIPGQSWYLIDKEDKNLQPGNIYTFVSRSIPPTIKEGELITKYLRGVPGDRVTLNADGVFVNGVKYADKYLFARWMGIDPAKFYGEKILGPNEYWFMGTGVTSFDSRYWGTVKAEQIVGRSYALF